MMAQPCVFTSAASASSSLIRFNTASPIPSSCSATTTLSLPSHHRFPSRSSKLRNIPVDQRNARNYAVKKGLNSVYSGGLWESNWSSCQGISSIRDDLQVPSSHRFQVNNVYGEEGPPPVVQEGLQFVASKLFEHRIIRCGGPVDADMANFIVAQLLYLDAVDPNKDIVMYVNSPGGSVTAGMAIFDMMRHIRPDVSTVCVGLAASMGAFLLAAGTKGKRYSLPDSRIMIHQPLSGAQGFGTQINIQRCSLIFSMNIQASNSRALKIKASKPFRIPQVSSPNPTSPNPTRRFFQIKASKLRRTFNLNHHLFANIGEDSAVRSENKHQAPVSTATEEKNQRIIFF